MKNRDEIVRLLWTLVGALVGVAVGFGLMTVILNTYKLTPLLWTVVVLGLCGGGLIGGGYLALTLISKRQRVARKKYFEEKKKRKKKR